MGTSLELRLRHGLLVCMHLMSYAYTIIITIIIIIMIIIIYHGHIVCMYCLVQNIQYLACNIINVRFDVLTTYMSSWVWDVGPF